MLAFYTLLHCAIFIVQLATTKIFRAKWTEQIHDEWIRNLLTNRSDLQPDRLEKLRSLINKSIPDSLVTGFGSSLNFCSQIDNLFALCKHESCRVVPTPMHLISAGKLIEAAGSYSGTVEVARNFAKKVELSSWQNLVEVQADYPAAESVGNFTVFNIKGNRYRLILSIDYEAQVAYFKYFLTHAQYSKDEWKNDPYY